MTGMSVDVAAWGGSALDAYPSSGGRRRLGRRDVCWRLAEQLQNRLSVALYLRRAIGAQGLDVRGSIFDDRINNFLIEPPLRRLSISEAARPRAAIACAEGGELAVAASMSISISGPPPSGLNAMMPLALPLAMAPTGRWPHWQHW
jgi:hypothetical protein